MKKRRRKYKSVITQRIFNSTKKVGSILCFLLLIFSYGKIQNTNSFFADSAVSIGNTFSSGYWIVPEIEVTSPENGDEWQVGSAHNITWTASSSDPLATAEMEIDINYRCNGGSWNNIVAGTNNDGSYSWIAPTNISDSCEIRLFATDYHELTGMDDSDEFEISYMVVLNEFVPYPAVGLSEMVEVYNYGTEPIDVNNWFVTDNQGPASHRRVINSAHTDTASTIINPSSSRFLVVTNYADFYLNNTGSDEIRLYDNAGNLIDDHNFSDAVQAKSYARIPDGVGDWVDPVPTPGEENNPSNDIEDMKKYYAEACFKDGKIICKESFLKSLGLLEEKIEEVLPVEIVADPIVDSEIDTEPLVDPIPTPEPTPTEELIIDLAPAHTIEPENELIEDVEENKNENSEEEKAKLEAEEKAKAEEAKLEAEKKVEEEKAEKEAEEKEKAKLEEEKKKAEEEADKKKEEEKKKEEAKKEEEKDKKEPASSAGEDEK